jgi:hypothetical protein
MDHPSKHPKIRLRDFGGASLVRIPPIAQLRANAIVQFGQAITDTLDDQTLRARAQVAAFRALGDYRHA